MLRRTGSQSPWVYVSHGTRPRITGDGFVRFAYDRCARDMDERTRTPGLRERVALTYALSDGPLRHGDLVESVTTTRAPARCIQAACPVVYAHGARVGEVLRNLRDPSLAEWQPLALPVSAVEADGTITVTLREELHEVTSLDAVRVEADGVMVDPQTCPAALSCAEDGAYDTLRAGDARTFTFRVGHPRRVRLWARGYYVPLRDP